MHALFEEIIIASWLYDIGQIALRAGIQQDSLSKESQNFVPSKKNPHILYTLGFITFADEIQSFFPQSIRVKEVKRLISFFDAPTQFDELLIVESDKLARGGVVESNQSSELKSLQHIVSMLNLNENKKNTRAFYKLEPLEPAAVLASEKETVTKEQYKILWESLKNDIKQFKKMEFNAFLQSLNSLLQRYLWAVPLDQNEETVSLYHHAKMRTAFASTLYRYHTETKTESETELQNNEIQKFSFIQGDISGIQQYIFNLKTTKDNAKLLRARSFQLWILGEIISQYLCQRFSVSYVNVLTSAGGKFLLVVPNTTSTKELLSNLQLEIEAYFLKEFAGMVTMIISDEVNANGNDLQRQNIPLLLNKIGYNADICKQKKMQKALHTQGAIQHELYEKIQKYGICEKCGTFPKKDISETSSCKNCTDLVEIGKNLLRSNFINLDISELKSFADMVSITQNIEGENSYSINDYKAGYPVLFLPYTAPQGKYKDSIKTFEEIAQSATGNQKLAMFKADIDNLGFLFSMQKSFTAYAELSSMLHFFFSAYFYDFVQKKSWNNKKETCYSDVIYTVFSGGDDLCVIGPWDSIMHFAKDFNAELQKFTHNNLNVTLSAGISVVNDKIPVRTIADMAEKLLEKSKDRKQNDKIIKNAITVFSTTAGWDNYSQSMADGQKIQEYLNEYKEDSKKGLSSGVVYKMIDFANRAEKIKGGNIEELLCKDNSKKLSDEDNIKKFVHNGVWKSNFRYSVSRVVEDEDIKKWVLKFGTNPESMINSRIAVSYALYTQRNSK